MYGFHAYGDGYYFNVARPLSVISGHGGYDDGPAGYFFPPMLDAPAALMIASFCSSVM